MIELGENIFVPEEALTFHASRSSGPGGQNVNKVNTRVTLHLDLSRCDTLTDQQKQRICTKLATRIDKQDILRVISQKHRTQSANRKATLERLGELLQEALTRRPPRKPTRIPRSVREKRLQEKKQRGQLKRLRSQKMSRDD